MLAIDPGTIQSAWVLYRDGDVIDAGITENGEFITRLHEFFGHSEDMAVEMIASYGMPVGREVFETCLWIGRFIEHWLSLGGSHTLIYRKDVKMHLCQSMKAKDANIRQALIDLFGPGKELAIGKKASPGPLYGFKADMWAALGVAVTATHAPQGA